MLAAHPDQSLRIEAASLETGARSLYEDIKRLRDMDRSDFPDDYANARNGFRDEHDLDPRYAERIIVADRRIGGSENAGALFAHAMRNALPVHNYGDAQLVAIFEELTATVFRQKREDQGILEIADLERMLLAPLIPLPIASYEVSYVATKYGYLLDRKKDAALRAERSMVRGAASSVMRQWRRKTFWARTLNLLVRGHATEVRRTASDAARARFRFHHLIPTVGPVCIQATWCFGTNPGATRSPAEELTSGASLLGRPELPLTSQRARHVETRVLTRADEHCTFRTVPLYQSWSAKHYWRNHRRSPDGGSVDYTIYPDPSGSDSWKAAQTGREAVDEHVGHHGARSRSVEADDGSEVDRRRARGRGLRGGGLPTTL